jgi:hypothetical protein
MSGNDSVFGYSVVGNGTLFSPSNSYNDPFEDMFTKVVFILYCVIWGSQRRLVCLTELPSLNKVLLLVLLLLLSLYDDDYYQYLNNVTATYS